MHRLARPRYNNALTRLLVRNNVTLSMMDPREQAIYTKLKQRLNPAELQVKDVSGGCGSMYAINVVSDDFKGLTTIKQHRLVNEVLKDDIVKWHGLQLKTSAPK